jgi:hypothetical protein
MNQHLKYNVRLYNQTYEPINGIKNIDCLIKRLRRLGVLPVPCLQLIHELFDILVDGMKREGRPPFFN